MANEQVELAASPLMTITARMWLLLAFIQGC